MVLPLTASEVAGPTTGTNKGVNELPWGENLLADEACHWAARSSLHHCPRAS